jgi:hypothetical protein
MKKTPNGSPLTRRRVTAALAFVALAVGVAAAVASGFKSPATAVRAVANLSKPAAVSPAPAQLDNPADRLETELITITPTGFDPADITRPQGRVVVEVDNRSGLEEVELRLDRSNGVREKEVRVHRTALDWSGEVNLRPGTYFLGEAGHPDWACRITVTPRSVGLNSRARTSEPAGPLSSSGEER